MKSDTYPCCHVIDLPGILQQTDLLWTQQYIFRWIIHNNYRHTYT